MPHNQNLPAHHLPPHLFEQSREVVLGMPDISDQQPLRTIVGASVAVCLIVEGAHWCAVRQILLPSLAHGHRHDAMLQADAYLEDLFNQLRIAANIQGDGLAYRKIKAKIFGGADFGAGGLCFSDGAQSLAFVRSWLHTRNVQILAESVGGTSRRELILQPSKGVVYCRQTVLDSQFLGQERELLAHQHEVSASHVELF